jgi:hypothetical protein
VYVGGLQELQTRDWYRIVINDPEDKDRSTANPILKVRPVANTVREAEGLVTLYERLVQDV